MKNNARSLKSIDIVIPWVDPSDPVWQADKSRYMADAGRQEDTREIRFRDWDNLQYVFRSIEKYAPWVRKVHFLTYGHIPAWMNTDCPKLHIVRHEEFIPKEYLPVFSSHVIELNMHRIEGLSEQFIYFNDDIFLLKPVRPGDFFKKGLPCDCLEANLIEPSLTNFTPIVFNTVGIINQHFNKRELLRRHPGLWFNPVYSFKTMLRSFLFLPWPGYTGFRNHHLAVPYRKSTLETVWKEEPEVLMETCSHRFRDNSDVNQYIFRFWQLASGKFSPRKPLGRYFKITGQSGPVVDYIKKQKGSMVCINDEEFDDFIKVRDEINAALDQLLPDRSEYEIEQN